MAAVLHQVEDPSDKLPLDLHVCGKLSTQTLYCSTENATLIEVEFRQSMIAKRMRFRPQYFRIVFDLALEVSVALTRNNLHAVARVLVLTRFNRAASRIGSKVLSAMCRTTGTTTPSPVR